jgi:hypothetical protein
MIKREIARENKLWNYQALVEDEHWSLLKETSKKILE